MSVPYSEVLQPEAGRRHGWLAALAFMVVVLLLAVLGAWRASSFERSAGDTVMRGKAAKAFESHYDQRFPVRTLGVNLWAAADYLLFHEGRPGVVLGKDDWLYTDEEFKAEDGYAQTIAVHEALIDWVHAQLSQRGVNLLVAVVPAKARVYAEHLGRRRPTQAHADLYARALQHLEAQRIAAPDLLRVLDEEKTEAPSFLRADTHWTPDGAAASARAIAAQLGALGWVQPGPADAYATTRDALTPYKGDLFNFLPLDPYFTWLLPPQDQVSIPHTHASTARGDSTDLFADAAAPDIALVGTSYSAIPAWDFVGALRKSLGHEVLSYAREGAGPFDPMLEYLRGEDFRKAPPKVLIWEVPERYLALREDLSRFELPDAVLHPGIQ